MAQSDFLTLAVRWFTSVWTAVQVGARERVDAASLAVFRVVFGLVGLLIVARFFAYGWIGELYVEPARHFTYVGFGWVKPWPGVGMYAYFATADLVPGEPGKRQFRLSRPLQHPPDQLPLGL